MEAAKYRQGGRVTMPDMPIFAFILLGVLMFVFAGISFFFFLYDHRDRYYRYADDEVMTGTDFFC